nr:LPS export ABC transporter periplasmic protein LptC [Pyxidicoccus fallax]
MSASLVVLVAAFAGCSPRRAPGPQQPEDPPPQVVLYGARMNSFEGERLSLSGTAERLTYQRAGGDVQGTNATLKLPPGKLSEGAPPGASGGVEVSAPNMEGNLTSKQVVGSGGVVIKTGDGMVARTPRLTYDANTQRAHGNEGVTVTGPDYRMRADRFELSFPDETFIFAGSVETVLGAAE